MKPLLYIGASLLVGAGIYGFVDYKKTSHSREFESLYRKEEKKEVKEPVAAKVAPAVVSAALVTEKKETVAENKKPAVATKKVMKKKKKTLNRKLFSRAPLREEQEIAEVLPEPAKVEIQ